MKCAHCGKEFEPARGQHGRQKYCSKKCRNADWVKEHPDYFPAYRAERREESKKDIKTRLIRLLQEADKVKVEIDSETFEKMNKVARKVGLQVEQVVEAATREWLILHEVDVRKYDEATSAINAAREAQRSALDALRGLVGTS